MIPETPASSTDTTRHLSAPATSAASSPLSPANRVGAASPSATEPSPPPPLSLGFWVVTSRRASSPPPHRPARHQRPRTPADPPRSQGRSRPPPTRSRQAYAASRPHHRPGREEAHHLRTYVQYSPTPRSPHAEAATQNHRHSNENPTAPTFLTEGAQKPGDTRNQASHPHPKSAQPSRLTGPGEPAQGHRFGKARCGDMGTGGPGARIQVRKGRVRVSRCG